MSITVVQRLEVAKRLHHRNGFEARKLLQLAERDNAGLVADRKDGMCLVQAVDVALSIASALPVDLALFVAAALVIEPLSYLATNSFAKKLPDGLQAERVLLVSVLEGRSNAAFFLSATSLQPAARATQSTKYLIHSGS